ncbi:MAG: hypothetical protein J6K80_06620 [Oscillospiraceae bacterium]|nr:hypothetical protein [Oscillospiraceae bacterium]
MRKIKGFLMAVVMTVGITACSEPVKEIEIIKNSETVKPVELNMPNTLELWKIWFSIMYRILKIHL